MKYEHLFSLTNKETGLVIKDNIKPEELQQELDFAVEKLKYSGVSFNQAIIAVKLNLVYNDDSN